MKKTIQIIILWRHCVTFYMSYFMKLGAGPKYDKKLNTIAIMNQYFISFVLQINTK